MGLQIFPFKKSLEVEQHMGVHRRSLMCIVQYTVCLCLVCLIYLIYYMLKYAEGSDLVERKNAGEMQNCQRKDGVRSKSQGKELTLIGPLGSLSIVMGDQAEDCRQGCRQVDVCGDWKMWKVCLIVAFFLLFQPSLVK